MTYHERVYTLTGMVAHLLPTGAIARAPETVSLCGLTCWPTYWRGTNGYAEIRQAQDMPVCQTCQRIADAEPDAGKLVLA